ncbi:MAG: hypothetical protein ACK5KP_06030 [Paludibacteraceae bacterium]
MLKEDYIMRLLQHFFESLSKWLSKEKEESPELIARFNNELVKPYLDKDMSFFETKTEAELVEYFNATYPDERERLSRLEILAELFYRTALLESDEIVQKKQYSNSLNLLLSIDLQSKDYSMERVSRIDKLTKMI